MSEPELRLALPARAENVIVVRQAVAGLGEAIGLPEQRVNDMKTVITEACNNVVVHAYEDEPGPLMLTATTSPDNVEITVADAGSGFQPRAAAGEASLGLGLPLIAALADSFSIYGRAGEGTSLSVRFDLAETERGERNGTVESLDQQLAMKIAPGAIVRPVLARVIGALATRAEFSFERLSDTVLLGDAVSAHKSDDFSDGSVGIAISDGDGTLEVRVGPLVEGGGERILDEMRIPGADASLKGLARSMEVTAGKTADGTEAEYLVFEVSGQS